MLKHIVMIKAKKELSPSEKKEKLNAFKKALEDLVPEINTLKKMEVGLNINSKPSAYDLVLTSEFENDMGLDMYRVHPKHLEVLDMLKELAESTAVVDYYYH